MNGKKLLRLSYEIQVNRVEIEMKSGKNVVKEFAQLFLTSTTEDDKEPTDKQIIEIKVKLNNKMSVQKLTQEGTLFTAICLDTLAMLGGLYTTLASIMGKLEQFLTRDIHISVMTSKLFLTQNIGPK